MKFNKSTRTFVQNINGISTYIKTGGIGNFYYYIFQVLPANYSNSPFKRINQAALNIMPRIVAMISKGDKGTQLVQDSILRYKSRDFEKKCFASLLILVLVIGSDFRYVFVIVFVSRVLC